MISSYYIDSTLAPPLPHSPTPPLPDSPTPTTHPFPHSHIDPIPHSGTHPVTPPRIAAFPHFQTPPLPLSHTPSLACSLVHSAMATLTCTPTFPSPSRPHLHCTSPPLPHVNSPTPLPPVNARGVFMGRGVGFGAAAWVMVGFVGFWWVLFDFNGF